jgi:heme/copper-type cytochrome/quinol oxidase subunit 2
LPSWNLDATRQNGDAHTTSVGAGTVVRKLLSVGSCAESKQHILQVLSYGMALASTRYRRAMTRNELNRVSIAAVIFLVVFTLLTYAAVKFRRGVAMWDASQPRYIRQYTD